MRPRYETERNRADQRRIIKAYCRHFAYDFEPTEDLDRADYEIFDEGRLIGYAEVKRRYIKHDQYDTIMLSEQKVKPLLEREVPCLFVVGFNDGLGWCRLTAENTQDVRYGGRTVQTRDDGDVENVCHIPTSSFTFATFGGWIDSNSPWSRDELV